MISQSGTLTELVSQLEFELHTAHHQQQQERTGDIKRKDPLK